MLKIRWASSTYCTGCPDIVFDNLLPLNIVDYTGFFWADYEIPELPGLFRTTAVHRGRESG